MTTAMLEIRVIGELEVELSGTKAELPPSRRARALLGWLAVHPGRHHRSRLAGMFWPDVLEVSARASLRSAIWALRSALGASFGRYLATDRDTVTLAGEDLRVDLREFRRLAAAGQPEAAVAWCRGELLPEMDDEWLGEAREEFERDLGEVLRELTRQAAATGGVTAAVGWARRRATLSPLDESATADLIRTLIDAGDASAALAAYASLRQRLDAELGIGVSAATAALVAPLAVPPGGLPSIVWRAASSDAPSSLAAGSLAMDAPVTGSPVTGSPVTGSPVTGSPVTGSPVTGSPVTGSPVTGSPVTGSPVTGSPVTGRAQRGMIGRDRQFAELTEAWRRAGAGAGGVVLLEGDGGIGKTRLVQELRRTAERDRPGAAVVAAVTVIGASQATTPFGVWTDALTDLLGMRPPPGDQAWAGDLARIVPAMAYLTKAHPAHAAATQPAERVQICEAVVQFLAWSVREPPLLLALEDLHLADPASLELVAYVGRRLAGCRFWSW